jgi:hypothetical protein
VRGAQIDADAVASAGRWSIDLASSALRLSGSSHGIRSAAAWGRTRCGDGGKHIHGLQLHFGLGDDLGGLNVGELGQLDLRHQPAAVGQRAGKRGWPTTLPVSRTAAASKPACKVMREPSASLRTGRA